MAHYALLDNNNIVTQVIVGVDETEKPNAEEYYSDIYGVPVKRTSYNTNGNQHINGGVPFRKNYAGIGFSYDPNLDAFIPPKPFPSWILDTEKGIWRPPVPYPQPTAEELALLAEIDDLKNKLEKEITQDYYYKPSNFEISSEKQQLRFLPELEIAKKYVDRPNILKQYIWDESVQNWVQQTPRLV